MEITKDVIALFANFALIAFGIAFTSATVLGIFAIRHAGVESIKPVAELIIRGDALRMITVIFIILAVAALMTIDKIDGPVGATILSGISGYVLGSGMRNKKRKRTEENEHGTNA